MRLFSLASASLLVTCVLPSAAAPTAGESQPAIGFSRLVVRLDGQSDIGVGGLKHDVRILERMRAKGFHAVGAENLVFGKDKSSAADFLLGGTVRELECVTQQMKASCRIGLEWELLSVARDEVVYKTMARAAVFDMPVTQGEQHAERLLDAALDKLLSRPMFRAIVQEGPSPEPVPATAKLKACAAATNKLPAGSEDAMKATAVVSVGSAHGSGFFVSPDGFLLTAAHVVAGGAPKVRLRDGTVAAAVVVRRSTADDVALLRISEPWSACLAPRADEPPVGTEVYAIGAPIDLSLALAKGIVSGRPVVDGRPHLQTDAPINPGNSGGPLVDGDGAALGIVSAKLVGAKIEGLGFAIPIQRALKTLGLTLGPSTDETLRKEASTVAKIEPFVDAADPVPTLDAAADAAKAKAQAAAEQKRLEDERDKATPVGVSALRVLGITAVVGGAAMLGYGATLSDPPSYLKSGGWTLVTLGTGAFICFLALRPSLPRHLPVTTAVHIGPTSVRWEVAF